MTNELITFIREIHRQRNDFLRTEGDLERRIKAICRRSVGYNTFLPAEVRAPLMKEAEEMYAAIESGETEGRWAAYASTVQLREMRDQAQQIKKSLEKRMVFYAKQLHVAEFVEATPGFGFTGLGQIVGEAGDLHFYDNPAKLWKRMGLGLISTGERQQKFLDKDKAIEAGYNPARRSVMYVIGDSMIKQQGPYRSLYLHRKEVEKSKAEAKGLRVLPAARIKVGDKSCMSEMHVHRRSQRYMEKRLLADLWCKWTRKKFEYVPQVV